jgi:hypothetical protein
MTTNINHHRSNLFAVRIISFALFLLFAAATPAQTQWTTTDSNISNTNSGNVGVGTSNPGVKLDVNGLIRSLDGTGFTIGSLGGVNRITVNSSAPIFRILNSGDAYTSLGVLGLSVGSSYASIGPPYAGAIFQGNVGIGTAAPANSLDVNNVVRISPFSPNTSGSYINAGAALRLMNGNIYQSGGSETSSIQFGGMYNPGGTQTEATYNYVDWSAGWLRIRNNQQTKIQIGAGDEWGRQDIYLNPTAGNVGIGTTSPASRLEVVTGTADPFFFNGTYNKFKSASGWTYLESYHGAEIVIDNSGNYSDRTFTISKGASRIGGGNPTPLLTVNENGNVNISGTINAKYQDVAEWVPSSEQFSAGTVVVLDSTKSNQVTSSSISYDTRVAGVVSEQPGIVLGERSDGKVLVAATGRVRVKVDATKAPIHIGDLLVTSDIPGVAMKSEPVEFAGRKMHMPGTLIGKALEPLEKGKGEILVLLSLQ